MARKEVLVQLDDELLEELDALAKRLGTNRSELFRRMARSLLEAADWAKADEELVAAYRAKPQDPWIIEAANRLAGSTGDKW